MQLALSHHVESWIVTKMTIQEQISQVQSALDVVQEALQHLPDALQLRIQFHYGLVLVTATFGSPSFLLGSIFLNFLGLLFGLTGGFFCCRADHLFHLNGVRSPLL